MIGSEAKFIQSADDGFTILELLIVLLIIAILLSIAIPTFLSVTNTANSTSATSTLQNAILEAKSLYVQADGSFQYVYARTSPPLSLLQQDEPSIHFVPGGTVSKNPNTISVLNTYGTPSYQAVFFAVYNGTDTCYFALDIAQELASPVAGESIPGNYYYSQKGNGANCSAYWAVNNVTDSQWSNKLS